MEEHSRAGLSPTFRVELQLTEGGAPADVRSGPGRCVVGYGRGEKIQGLRNNSRRLETVATTTVALFAKYDLLPHIVYVDEIIFLYLM